MWGAAVVYIRFGFVDPQRDSARITHGPLIPFDTGGHDTLISFDDRAPPKMNKRFA